MKLLRRLFRRKPKYTVGFDFTSPDPRYMTYADRQFLQHQQKWNQQYRRRS